MRAPSDPEDDDDDDDDEELQLPLLLPLLEPLLLPESLCTGSFLGFTGGFGVEAAADAGL